MAIATGKSATEARFWAKVLFTDGCWIWTGSRNRAGYGAFGIRAGHTVGVHRYAYELLIGPIPRGLVIDHRCENQSCVRPGADHCVVTTQRVNVLRGSGVHAQNARKTHCKYGHEFTEENTRLLPTGRQCRECVRRRVREWRINNAEINRAMRHAYYMAHREEIIAKVAAWQRKHRELGH